MSQLTLFVGCRRSSSGRRLVYGGEGRERDERAREFIRARHRVILHLREVTLFVLTCILTLVHEIIIPLEGSTEDIPAISSSRKRKERITKRQG